MIPVEVLDLPMAVEHVLKVIEKKGPQWKHHEDPDHPDSDWSTTPTNCFNVFVERDEDNEILSVKPGCLIGSALIEMGLDPMWFVDLKGEQMSFDDIVNEWPGGRDVVTEAARRYLQVTQAWQDTGDTWGEAHMRGLQGALRYRKLTEKEQQWMGPRGD